MDVVISKMNEKRNEKKSSKKRMEWEWARESEEGKKRLTAKNVICHLVFCGKTFIEKKSGKREKKKKT